MRSDDSFYKNHFLPFFKWTFVNFAFFHFFGLFFYHQQSTEVFDSSWFVIPHIVTCIVNPVSIRRGPFMYATINGCSFVSKSIHARSILVMSPAYSPYRGIIPCKQLSYIYKLTSEEIYRKHSGLSNGSIHIYSIYHRLMLAHWHTELYPHPLVGFQLTKSDIPNYRHPIVGMSLSEHVMTGQQRWRVWNDDGDSCVEKCK